MIKFISSFRDDFNFLEPVFLFLLIPLGLMFLMWLVLVLLRMRSRPVMTYGSKYPLIGKSKLWGFFLIATALLVMALAKPYLPGGMNLSRGDVELILVIDRSISMRANDVGESRLEIAKREALGIEPLLTDGDKIALFVFGRESHRKIYLTPKHNAVFERAADISFPGRGHLKGDGLIWDSDFASMLENIYQSMDRQDAHNEGYTGKKYAPQKRSNRIVILITEGEDQFKLDRPVTAEAVQYKKDYLTRLNKALAEFRRRGLEIYPVGIGTQKGVSWISLLRGYDPEKDYPKYLLEDKLPEGFNLALSWKGKMSRLDRENLIFLARSTGVDLTDYVWTIDTPTATSKSYLRSVINSKRSRVPDFSATGDDEQLRQYFILVAVIIIGIGIVTYPFSGYFRKKAPRF